ncbi:MAG: hypothetical protein NTV31_06000 [Bacteroidia bacterium]|nr:hypothetical protein [Bacteroidia bacterium]
MKRIVNIFLLILVPLVGNCQAEKQLVPSDLKQLTVVTEPSTLYKGFFRAGMAMSFGVVDKYFTNDRKKEYFLNSAWATNSSFNLSLQYGITDRIQVDAVIPYSNELRQSESLIIVPVIDSTVNYSFTLKGRGIGDCYLTLKYQILPEKESKTSLTGSIDLTFPTGEKNPTNIKSENIYDLPTGTGSFSSTFGLKLRKIQYPFSFIGYTYFTYNLPGSKIINVSDTEEKEFKYGNRIDAGANINFHLNEWIALTNEFNLYYSGKTKIDNEIPDYATDGWAVSYEPRLVFQIKRFRISEAVRIPLAGKGVSADPLYVLITQYVF